MGYFNINDYMASVDSIPEEVLIECGNLLLLYELQSAQLVSKFWYWWVHRHLAIFKRYHFRLTREFVIQFVDIERFKYSTITISGMRLSEINKFLFLSSVPYLILSHIDEDCQHWTSDNIFLTHSLTLSYCQKLLSIDIDFSNLESVKIDNCPKLKRYPGNITVRSLDVVNYNLSSTLPDLLHYPKLRELTLFGIHRPIHLQSVSDLKLLSYLDFSHCPHISSLSSLTGLENLKLLFITHSNISNLAPLSQLTKLDTLDLSYCKNIRDVSPVRHLKCLTLHLHQLRVVHLMPSLYQ